MKPRASLAASRAQDCVLVTLLGLRLGLFRDLDGLGNLDAVPAVLLRAVEGCVRRGDEEVDVPVAFRRSRDSYSDSDSNSEEED